jgi:predicted secreted acid phosphatase
MILTVVLLCYGCAGGQANRVNLNSVVWMQSSAEYRAVSLGAFNMARQNLDSALEDRTWTALPSQVPANSEAARALSELPPAVILDIDETVLSTLPYQAWLVKHNIPFTPLSWHAWVSEASAEALPGALDFVHYAMQNGVTVFYLSNRRFSAALDTNENGQIDPGEEQVVVKPFTIANLLRLGFLPQEGISNTDSVLLRGETDEGGRVKKGWASADKSDRRESLSADYRVVLIMGDNLNDFISYQKHQDGEGGNIPVDLDLYQAHWGRSWIMLPNPIYGPWEKQLHDFTRPLSAEEKTRIKLDSLHTWQ